MRWFALHGRELPWRDTIDPYYIWVSEVILQQTRVAQGIDYYYRFIAQFPTVEALAAAPLDEVMKAWQGLGYYTRARNLHTGAQQVVEQHGGKLPRTYAELLKIKGLGAYSAAAVASFAFNEAVPAVDGNVYRILARVFGVFTPTDSTQGRKEFFELANELMDRQHPATFNQAIIDFGALVCTFRQPHCGECPMADRCYALHNNMIHKLPVKGKRIAVRDRYFYYLMVRQGDHTFVRRRQERDIWHSLYEFPLIELPAPLPAEALVLGPEWAELIGASGFRVLSVSGEIRHQLTHINIHAQFIIVEVERTGYKLRADYHRVPIEELERYSVPRLIDAYMAAEPAQRYFRRS